MSNTSGANGTVLNKIQQAKTETELKNNYVNHNNLCTPVIIHLFVRKFTECSFYKKTSRFWHSKKIIIGFKKVTSNYAPKDGKN